MNVLTVTGRLTTDPVRRDTTHGVVCELALAVDGRPRLWLTVETWQLAGRCAQHLHAGRRVAASGALICSEYLNRSGERTTRWFLRANQITYLDGPDDTTIDAHNASRDPAEVA